MSGSAEKVEVLHGSHFMPMGGSQFQKPSREQMRKAKALEVARKNGTLPHEIDHDGKEVNPHIPQFISKTPWYLDTYAEASEHVNLLNVKSEPDTNIAKSVASKDSWRNQRPAKRLSENGLEAAESVRLRESKVSRTSRLHGDGTISWDGKRDRWNGYDGNKHEAVFEKFQHLDRARLENCTDYQVKGDRPSNEDFVESSHMFDSSTHTSTRNLRIREDRARYLLNMKAPDSASNSRSKATSSEPLGSTMIVPESQEGFERACGSDEAYAQANRFAWQKDKVPEVSVNAQANPTENELSRHRLAKARTEQDVQRKSSILARYG